MKKTCSRCILNSDFPGIQFDSEGVCNNCHSFDESNKKYAITEKNTKKLATHIEKIKKDGCGKEYDCIIGVSGGRDSTYCLYIAQKWGLRPLAVHYDNNMNSKIAVENIKKACSILDIDLSTFIVNWEEYKDLQRSFLFASVPSVDIPTDHAFITVLHKIAYKKHIKYIFLGSSFRTEGAGSVEWSLHNDEKFILDIQKKFGTRPLKEFPIRSIRDWITWRFRGNEVVRPYYITEYNNEKVSSILTEELGWKYYGGHHFENIFTRWAFGYLLPTKFNIDKRVTDYSALVLSHQMTRDEALEKMKQPIYTKDQEKEDRRYITSKLELSTSEMDSILNNPPKRNTDYAHHNRIERTLVNYLGPHNFP
jgi:N-acetyl sugar amidotransferase